MTNLTLGTFVIRQFDGLYSLNDLHKAENTIGFNTLTWKTLRRGFHKSCVGALS